VVGTLQKWALWLPETFEEDRLEGETPRARGRVACRLWDGVVRRGGTDLIAMPGLVSGRSRDAAPGFCREEGPLKHCRMPPDFLACCREAHKDCVRGVGHIAPGTEEG